MLVGREMDGEKEKRKKREEGGGGREEGTLSCLPKTILKRVNTSLRNNLAYTLYMYCIQVYLFFLYYRTCSLTGRMAIIH